MTDEEFRRLQDKIEFDKNSLTTGGPIAIVILVILLLIVIGCLVIGYFGG